MNLTPADLLNPAFNFLDALNSELRRLPLPGVSLAGAAGDRLDIQRRLAAETATGKLRRSSPQASSSRRDRRANQHRQLSASRLTKRGTATTKQRIKHDDISPPATKLCRARPQTGKRRHVEFRLTNCIVNLHSHAHEAR